VWHCFFISCNHRSFCDFITCMMYHMFKFHDKFYPDCVCFDHWWQKWIWMNFVWLILVNSELNVSDLCLDALIHLKIGRTISSRLKINCCLHRLYQFYRRTSKGLNEFIPGLVDESCWLIWFDLTMYFTSNMDYRIYHDRIPGKTVSVSYFLLLLQLLI
jgi:hypothetical protein